MTDMNFNQYQELAYRTALVNHDLEKRRLIAALGLTGEAGEVGELIKKDIGHGHVMDFDKLAKELGDVLWYAALISSLYGLNLGTIAEANIEKLRKRYPDGFSSTDSQKRVDTNEE